MNNFDTMISKVQGMLGNVVGQQPVFNQDITSPTYSQAANQIQTKPNQQELLAGILGSVAPEDDAVTQAFTHNLGAIVGDATRTFQPEEIQSALKQLQGQALTGDYYKDNAIKIANYLNDKKSGAVMNAPRGGQIGL